MFGERWGIKREERTGKGEREGGRREEREKGPANQGMDI